MRYAFLFLLVVVFMSATISNAQTPRTFHSQTIVLDNGGAKTDTVKFTGNVNQMLDISGLATTNGNLTLDTTLDMNHKNLINGGNGSFAGLTSTGAVTVGYSIPAFNVPYTDPYIVAPSDYFIETIFNNGVTLPASYLYPGRVIKIANMCPNALTINFAPGDHTVTTPPIYSYSITLNSGACITLISDGGFSGWVQAGH